MSAWQISLLIALGLGLVELVTSSFVFLGFAVGTLVVSLTEAISGRFELNRDLTIFALASIVAFVVMRRVSRRRDDTQTAGRSDINRY